LDFNDNFFCAQSYVSRAAKGQLEGSRIRYDQKMKKYLDLGASFKPLDILPLCKDSKPKIQELQKSLRETLYAIL
jgi:hypothetical protein